MAYALMIGAGVALLASFLELFANTRLMWLSAAMSITAILISIAIIVWRARDSVRPESID